MNNQKELRQFLVTMDKNGNTTWVENGEFVSNPMCKQSSDLKDYYNSIMHIMNMQSITSLKQRCDWWLDADKNGVNYLVSGTKIIDDKLIKGTWKLVLPKDQRY